MSKLPQPWGVSALSAAGKSREGKARHSNRLLPVSPQLASALVPLNLHRPQHTSFGVQLLWGLHCGDYIRQKCSVTMIMNTPTSTTTGSALDLHCTFYYNSLRLFSPYMYVSLGLFSPYVRVCKRTGVYISTSVCASILVDTYAYVGIYMYTYQWVYTCIHTIHARRY